MVTTYGRRQKKPSGILREVCTQSDWSIRLHRPGFGALLLLLPVILNETWLNYALICESIPFFFTEPKEEVLASRLRPEEWRRSHQACLRAICRITDQIEFDCKVDETGESAHMLVVDDASQGVPFDSEIPFPVDCLDTLNLMLGSDNFENLSDYLRSNLFQTESIDFIHYYENNLQPEAVDGRKKKALFQILPGQCAIWEILQQSWYEWYDGDTQGDPPPPIPLVDFGKAQPGQVVRIKASEYLCYENYIPKDNLKSWISAYEKVLKYRWYPSFFAALLASTAMEIAGLVIILMRLLPLTVFFVMGASIDPDPAYKMLRTMIEMWRIWRHLLGVYVMALAIAGSEQVYLFCALATASMLMYGNTKASMEWTFLHILSYGIEWEADIAAAAEPNLILGSIEDLVDIFIPAPGLCLKAIVMYMIFMSSSRIRNKQ
mmetsp:Transcript_10409/g.25186  ORF Transcript_10409/g.25186 Transcript_10409/m.25186 type:complete len:434 (+) Transcript_10409:101-1402(+)